MTESRKLLSTQPVDEEASTLEAPTKTADESATNEKAFEDSEEFEFLQGLDSDVSEEEVSDDEFEEVERGDLDISDLGAKELSISAALALELDNVELLDDLQKESDLGSDSDESDDSADKESDANSKRIFGITQVGTFFYFPSLLFSATDDVSQSSAKSVEPKKTIG